MNQFYSSKRLRKEISLIILIVLSCVFAVVWQQFQTNHRPQVATVTPVEISASTEPIQPIPLHIELNENKVALGEKLFNDTRLSRNNSLACVSCHFFDKGGTDRVRYSIGMNGASMQVNSPTVFNSEFNFKQHWNAIAENLEDQIDVAVTAPLVFDNKWQDVLANIKTSPEYVEKFGKTYSDGITRENIKDAIATFERSLYTPNSRFDKFLRGNKNAITQEEKDGYHLFKSYGCVSCHQGVNVGGNMFQKFGIIGNYFTKRGGIIPSDMGLYNVTKKESDRYVFKVPSLRNVAITPPYLHDGSAETLETAIDIMGKYQLGHQLDQSQIDLIVKFLLTLTGEYQGKPL